MDFFGIGIGEFLLILALGLIVLGPERLQGLARSGGRLIAQLLAWQHQSPEARMVQKMRHDFEQEVVELRDELVRAREQLDISTEMSRLQQETTATVAASTAATGQPLRSEEPPAPRSEEPPAPLPAAEEPPTPAEPARDSASPPPPAAEAINGHHTHETVEVGLPGVGDAAPLPSDGPPLAPPAVVAEANDALQDVQVQQAHLAVQVETLRADVQALHALLQARGLLELGERLPSQAQALDRDERP